MNLTTALPIVMLSLIFIASVILGSIDKLNKDYYQKKRDNCYSVMTESLQFDHEFATDWCSSQ